MAQIYNSEVTKRLIDDAKLQTSHDRVPTQLAEKIVPVLIANPERKVNVVKTVVRSTSGNSTLYTTPADKDFYLTTLTLGIIKDATCDVANASYSLLTYINGATVYLGEIPVITATASNQIVTLTFSDPVKIDRGKDLMMGSMGSYSAGVCVRTVAITGYTLGD